MTSKFGFVSSRMCTALKRQASLLQELTARPNVRAFVRTNKLSCSALDVRAFQGAQTSLKLMVHIVCASARSLETAGNQ